MIASKTILIKISLIYLVRIFMNMPAVIMSWKILILTKLNYEHNINNIYENLLRYLDSCEKEKERNLRKYFAEIKPSNNLDWPLLDPKDQWLAADRITQTYIERIEEISIIWTDFGTIGSNVKQFDFWSLLGEMQSYGLNNVIVNHQIERNKDNSLNISLGPAFLGEGGSLPNNMILQVLLKVLGIEDTEPIIQQLNNTDFEWLNLTQNYAESTESKQTTLQDITKLYPRLKLKTYFENLLGSEIHNIANITLENPEYFEYLNEKQWTKDDFEHLCNYLMMKFLFHLAEDSTAEYSPLECVKDLRRKFDLAVNYVYFKEFYEKERTQYSLALNNIWFKIKNTTLNIFEENHLNLSESQIIYLKRKLTLINVNRGNLPYHSYEDSLRAFYQDLQDLDASNYYRNHLLLLKHRFRKSLYYDQNQTYFRVKDNSMGGVSTPFYVSEQNMIVIPFGSFQSPLFSYNQTIVQQLSLFGFVLAHELVHAFDTTGLNYDQQGFPLTLPTDIIDQVNFTNSLECMQLQQPTETIDERIADLVGIKIVYRTLMENYAEGYKEDWRKEFFTNLAQFFCGKANINFIDHDADAVRLQQILMNFQPFSEAFGCAEGSPLNPKIKCRLY